MNEIQKPSESNKVDLDTNELDVAPRPPEGEASATTDELDRDLVTDLIQPEEEESLPAILPRGKGKASRAMGAREPVLRAVKHCHVGAIRDRNEDSCLVFASEAGGHFSLRPFGLYVVADGMGGHANGHVASKTASRVAGHHIIQNIYLPLMLDEGSSYQPPIQEVLTEAVNAANEAVFKLDPESDGGTTLTIALVLGRRLHIAHVGDSRLYLFTDDKLEIVSTDHSLVQRLQEVGQLTAEEATYYQYRHVLLRAVGQMEEVDIDTYMRRLPKTGQLLLCSDGLSSMVPDAKIEALMQQGGGAEAVADRLLKAALDAGGYDNITVVLVDFSL